MMAMDNTIAITPPILLGIDRKIAYANKKYHSGWIWTGVTIGFAGKKFSGSPNSRGSSRFIMININIRMVIPMRSLIEKYGWNGILSYFLLIPIGLLDPVWCRNNKWIITIAVIINGRRKWSVKNRVRVALLMENPPHNHFTISGPRYGIADSRLVITVAPQNDICPHGRTYPKNAVAIIINNIIIPTIHVIISLYDP